jgi:hypothetical protein
MNINSDNKFKSSSGSKNSYNILSMSQKCHEIVFSPFEMLIINENTSAIKKSIDLIKELFANYMHKSFQNKLKITTTLGKRLREIVI